jgi:hypothetical protein
MNTRQHSIIKPSVPPSFFLSLTPEQRKQLTQIIYSYKAHYSAHFSFSGEMIKKNGFVVGIWENTLWHEIIKPSGMTKNMFRIMKFIWFLEHSPRFKNTRLTKSVIVEEIKVMLKIYRLWPAKNLPYLERYGWLTVHILRHRQKQYFVSEKGLSLITAYSLRYQELFNDFFEPLSL